MQVYAGKDCGLFQALQPCYFDGRFDRDFLHSVPSVGEFVLLCSFVDFLVQTHRKKLEADLHFRLDIRLFINTDRLQLGQFHNS